MTKKNAFFKNKKEQNSFFNKFNINSTIKMAWELIHVH